MAIALAAVKGDDAVIRNGDMSFANRQRKFILSDNRNGKLEMKNKITVIKDAKERMRFYLPGRAESEVRGCNKRNRNPGLDKTIEVAICSFPFDS